MDKDDAYKKVKEQRDMDRAFDKFVSKVESKIDRSITRKSNKMQGGLTALCFFIKQYKLTEEEKYILRRCLEGKYMKQLCGEYIVIWERSFLKFKFYQFLPGYVEGISSYLAHLYIRRHFLKFLVL